MTNATLSGQSGDPFKVWEFEKYMSKYATSHQRLKKRTKKTSNHERCGDVFLFDELSRHR